MIDRIRLTSRLDLLVLGLKSHNFAMRSHSVPGSISAISATNCFSAFLDIQTKHNRKLIRINAIDYKGLQETHMNSYKSVYLMYMIKKVEFTTKNKQSNQTYESQTTQINVFVNVLSYLKLCHESIKNPLQPTKSNSCI